jgi:hypothetical protein
MFVLRSKCLLAYHLPRQMGAEKDEKSGETMKDKRHDLTALFFIANLALGAKALFAQSLPGPSVPKSRLQLVQQTKPATPGQPADAGTQQEMVMSSDDIRRAQQILKAKGFDPGAISGRIDAKTQEAVREFQKANELPATGVLDQKTADKLGMKLKGDKNSTPQQRQESTKPKAPTDLQLR